MEDIEKHLTELKERLTRIESIKTKENKKQKEIESLKNRISKLNPIEAKLSELEKRITFNLSEQLNRNLSLVDKDFEKLNEKNRKLKERIITLETQTLTKKLGDLNKSTDKKLSQIQEEFNGLKNRISKIETNKVAETVKELNERLGQIEALNLDTEAAKQTDLVKIEDKIGSLTDHIETFDTSVKKGNEHVVQLKELIGNLKQALNHKIEENAQDFEKKLEEKGVLYASLNKSTDKKLSQIQEEFNGLKNRISKIETNKVAETVKELNERLGQIEALNLDTEAAKQTDLVKIEDKIGSLTDHIETFDTSVKKGNEHVVQLKELIGNLKQALNHKIEENAQDFEKKLEEKGVLYNSKIDKSIKESEELRSEIWELVKGADDFKQKVNEEFKRSETIESETRRKLEVLTETLHNLESKLNVEFVQRIIRLEENEDFSKAALYELDKKIEKYSADLEEQYQTTKKQREDLDRVSARVFELTETQKKTDGSLTELNKKEEELRMSLLWAKKFREEFDELKNRIETDYVMVPAFDRLKQSYELVWNKLTENGKTAAQVLAIKDLLKDFKHELQSTQADLSKAKMNIKEVTERTHNLPTMEEQEKHTEQVLKDTQELFEKRNLQVLDLNNKLEQLMVKVFSIESDQEKVKDNISELKEIEKEVHDTLAELKKYELHKYKDKLRDLEVSKAGKGEINKLKEAFEDTKQKNAELIEMLLEKMGM